MQKLSIHLEVNGYPIETEIEPRTLLVDVLRDVAATKGVRIACEEGACGACSVHLNGEVVKSCLVLAARADGAKITAVEGLADGTSLR